MKKFLAAIAVVLPLALASIAAHGSEADEYNTAFARQHFDHLAQDDYLGYQALRAALAPSSRHSSPTDGAYEATELDNYGHAWIYLRALGDYDPRSPRRRTNERAYACYLTARRNAMTTVASEGRDATGAWLKLADHCAAGLRASLVKWAKGNAVPLLREDLQGAAPYRMFFPFDTARITAISDGIIRYIAVFERPDGAASMVVAGHTDRSGHADYNLSLSKKRADAVATNIARYSKNGPALRIHTAGETRPLAATRDGVRHPRNRRVEIMFGRL
jgi:outer membrane protein OmpA-like peptidoglycan-associated protein